MVSSNHDRSPLHERSNSNTNAVPLRIVPPTPPQQLRWSQSTHENPMSDEEDIYQRSVLPSNPSHVLAPPSKTAPFMKESGAASGSEDGRVSAASSRSAVSGQGSRRGGQSQAQMARQNLFGNKSNRNSSNSKPASIRSLPRKRRQVRINADKTFSVVSVEGLNLDDDLLKADDEVGSPSTLSPAGNFSQNRFSTSTDGFSPRTESSNSWRSETTNTTITAGQNSRHNSYLNTYGSEALHLQDFGRSSPLSSELSAELTGGIRQVEASPDTKGKQPIREPLSLMTALTSERGPRPDLSAAESFPSGQSTPTAEFSSDHVYPSSPPDLRLVTKARSSTNSSDQDSPELPPIPAPKVPSSASSEQETRSRGTGSKGSGSAPSRGASSHVSDGTVIHHYISHSSNESYRGTSQPSQTSSAENAQHGQRRVSPFGDENVVVLGRSSDGSNSEDANYEILGRTSQPASETPSVTYQRYSTPSMEPNYEVLGFTSPPERHVRAYSATPNYEIFGRTSQPASSVPSPTRRFASDSTYPNYDKASPVDSMATSQVNSISNYDIHRDYTPDANAMQLPAQPRSAYSRESLLIPPLQPKGMRSDERLGYYKQHSRESLRSQSITSGTSTYADDFARAVAGGKPLTRIPSLKNISEAGTGSTSWLGSLSFGGSNHKASSKSWSGALSTVPSGSDADYSGRTSRQLDYRRKSTGLNTLHSVLSTDSRLSSSSGIPVNDRAETDSLEFPRPSYALGLREMRDPSVSTTRLVDEHDEHDDKITDIPVLHERPSRARVSSYYNDHARSNSMRSMGSSRSNSIIGNALPSWARVYYGSGERRFLGAPASTTDSGSTRHNSMRSGSPDPEAFPQNIISARRRPRESERRFPSFSMHSRHRSDRSGRSSRFGSFHSYSRSRSHSRVPSEYAVSISEPSNGESSRHSMDIRVVESSTNPRPSTQYSAGVGQSAPSSIALNEEGGRIHRSFMNRPRKPSSTWSPHLALDKRADPRANDWEMHSVEWSQGGLSSRRNRQIILFVIGFVLPPSWFLASFLPLPERAHIPMREEGEMRSRRELMIEMNAFWSPMDEKRLQSARWWRILNRIFSVAGVLILVLVVSIAVVLI